MPEITRHSKPFPQVIDQGGDTSQCTARAHPWWCTRVAGHDGEHQAGGMAGQMYASWPAESTIDRKEAS
jgi:hypothetical protein